MHQSIPKVSRVYHIEVRLLKCFQCNTPLIARYSIWSFSQASTGGWGIRLPLPTIEWTEASLFYASVCLVVCHIGDRISESFLIHYNRHCLLLYLVSLPSVDRRLGNYPDFEKVASASRLSWQDKSHRHQFRNLWPAMREHPFMPDTVTSACRFMWSGYRSMIIETGSELPDTGKIWHMGKPSAQKAWKMTNQIWTTYLFDKCHCWIQFSWPSHWACRQFGHHNAHGFVAVWD